MAILQGARITGSIIATTFIKASGFSGSLTASNLYVLGKAGIGTTSPSAKLTIVDNTNGGTINLVGRTSDDTAAINFRATGDASTYAYIAPDTNEFRLYHNDGFMSFYPGGSEKVRITSTGNVGIGTTSPGAKLQINNASDSRLIIYETGTAPYTATLELSSQVLGTYGATVQYTSDAETLTIQNYGRSSASATQGGILFRTKLNNTTATDVMVINGFSGNVGIGTTSPTQKLHVAGNTRINGIGAFGIAQSNWDSSIYGVEIGGVGNALWANAGSYIELNNNGYFDSGGWKYANTAASSRYELGVGAHYWFTAASGTAGNALTWSERMRLDNSGNLGIGTSSPSSLLQVHGASPFVRISNSAAENHGIKISYTTSDTHGLHLIYQPGSALSFIDNTYPVTAGYVYGDIYFRQNVAGTMTTRMTIKADGGNVGIGTSTPTQLLELRKTSASAIALLNYNDSVKLNLNASSGGAGYVGMVTNHPLIFVSNDTERVRIDTNGNLGIGTTSPSAKLHIDDASTPYIRITRSGTPTWELRNNYPSTEYGFSINNVTAGTTVLFAGQSGNVGIGTTSPAAKLHIEGNDIRLNTEGSYAEKSLYFRYSDNAKIMSDSYLTFLTSGTPAERMRITSVGNVGIGTTTVRGLLHVSGDIIRDTNLPYSWGTSAPYRTFSGAYSYANGGVNGVARYLLLWPQITNVNGQNGRFVNARLVVSRGATHAYNDTIIGDIVASAGYNSSANLYNYTPLIGSQLYFHNIVYNSVTYLAISLPISDFRWELTGYYGIEETVYYSPTFVYANTSGVGAITQLTDYTNESLAIYNKDGNVGIGTTSPSNKLTIDSDATGVSFADNGVGQLVIRGSTNTAKRLGLGIDTTNNIGVIQAQQYGTGQYPLALNPAGGNVGIGTTAPSGSLTIQTNGTQLRLQTASGPGSYYATIGSLYNSTHPFSIAVAGNSLTTAEYFGIYADSGGSNPRIALVNGSVGIGTTSPGSLLQVGASAANATATPTAIQLDNSYRNAVGVNTSLKFYLYKNGSETYGFGLNNNAGVEYHAGVSGNTTGHHAFYTDTTEKMRVTSTGNVGIGTSSPAAKLDVTSATDTFSLINATNGAQGNRAALFMAARNVNGNVGNVSIEAISVNNQQNDMVFRTGATTMGGFGTERMRIDTTGNVGIGTTSPTNKLHISGSSTNLPLKLEGLTSNATGYFLTVDNTTGVVHKSTSGASGTSGTSGANGSPGTSGTSGANGSPGTSGSNGANGSPGTSGTSGTSGANGSPGTSGSSGISSIKAWVHFNGGGTSGTSGISPNASNNVSSITDNGTGDYTINFTTAFANANYVVAGTATYEYENPGQSINNMFIAVPRRPNAQLAGSCRISTPGSDNVLYDCQYVRVLFSN